MDDYSVKYLISEIKSIVFKNIHQGLAHTKDHKFAAHERIFKIVMNLSTLSLTGWVAIVSWKFEAFELLRTSVYLSCGYFIISLILIVLSDLCIMLQSRCEEEIFSTQNTNSIAIFAQLENDLAGMINTGITDRLYLHQHSQDFIDKEFQILQSNEESEVTKAEKYSKGSWIFGITGVIFFFIAIAFSIFTMTRFIQTSQKIILESRTNAKHVKELKEENPSSSVTTIKTTPTIIKK